MGLSGCFRVVLFIENFIFWLIGAALIAAGAYILLSPELPAFLQILEGSQVICYVAIGVGTILFIIGFLGCCGAFKKNKCLLKTYSILLIVMVILEITAAILIWQLEEHVVTVLALGWRTLDSNSMAIVQQQFACCGFNEGSDSLVIPSAGSVPASCLDASGNVFQSGCYDKLKQTIVDNIVISASVAGSIVFLQIVSIVMACVLAAKDKETQVQPGPGRAWELEDRRGRGRKDNAWGPRVA